MNSTKFISFAVFFLNTFYINAQTGLPADITIIDSLEKPRLIIYKTDAKDFFFAKKNGKQWASWSFKNATFYPTEKFNILVRQIDKKGNPEIILSWKSENTREYGDGTGGQHSSNELTEIWNIDTQQILFSAMTYKEESDIIDMTEKRCHYSYDIEFNSMGEIILNKLQQEETNCASNKPDHLMGKYLFDGKQFVRKK